MGKGEACYSHNTEASGKPLLAVPESDQRGKTWNKLSLCSNSGGCVIIPVVPSPSRKGAGAYLKTQRVHLRGRSYVGPPPPS